jgi:hypothetical protein
MNVAFQKEYFDFLITNHEMSNALLVPLKKANFKFLNAFS